MRTGIGRSLLPQIDETRTFGFGRGSFGLHRRQKAVYRGNPDDYTPEEIEAKYQAARAQQKWERTRGV